MSIFIRAFIRATDPLGSGPGTIALRKLTPQLEKFEKCRVDCVKTQMAGR
jgi:hypothetical protein